MLCILKSTMANEPPGRLRTKNASYQDRNRPDPLNGKGNLPTPLGVAQVVDASKNTAADELAKDPAEVDVRGQVASQDDRHDFGSVGRCDGLEDTP